MWRLAGASGRPLPHTPPPPPPPPTVCRARSALRRRAAALLPALFVPLRPRRQRQDAPAGPPKAAAVVRPLGPLVAPKSKLEPNAACARAVRAVWCGPCLILRVCDCALTLAAQVATTCGVCDAVTRSTTSPAPKDGHSHSVRQASSVPQAVRHASPGGRASAAAPSAPPGIAGAAAPSRKKRYVCDHTEQNAHELCM